MSRTKLALALLAAALVAAPAAAGPIAWSYKTTLSDALGRNAIDLGTYRFAGPEAGSESTAPPAEGPVVTPVGNRLIESGTAQLAGIGKQDYRLYDVSEGGDPLTPTDLAVHVTLEVTDAASGEVGVAMFEGTLAVDPTSKDSPKPELTLSGVDGFAVMTLGGNTYDFRNLRPDDGATTTAIAMDYSITRPGETPPPVDPGTETPPTDTPSPVGVPEPATLALAGVGLAAVFGRRRLRR